MGRGQEPVDLGVEHQSGLFEIVDEVLTHPGTTDGQRFVGLLLQCPAELVPAFGQPAVANDQARGLAAHLFDHVATAGPEIPQVGDVSLDRERVDACILEGADQVEPVLVAAMEMDADRRCAVQPCSEGEGLTDPAVLAGTGDEHPFALEA